MNHNLYFIRIQINQRERTYTFYSNDLIVCGKI